jgi:nicotinate phosphoribosyltransferase
MADVKSLNVNANRQLFSANEKEILEGCTTDIYFVRTMDILNNMNIADRIVTAGNLVFLLVLMRLLTY